MTALESADSILWSLAKRIRDDDVLIVGVATPLAIAAGFLARELHAPGMTLIAAAAVQPSTHDIAEGLLDASAVVDRAQGTLGQAEVLDLIGRGAITLQFVSPAQVDARGAINTNLVPGRDGTDRRLPGALALPDTSVMVGRLIAYRAGHAARFLVPEVHFATGRPGAVRTVVTEVAEIAVGPEGGRLEALQPGASLEQAQAGCGFELAHDDPPPAAEPMPAEARRLLDELIDPHGVRQLEVREGRAAALATLADLAR